MGKVKALGYQVVNIDSTVLLERPKLSSYITQMRNNIAQLLDIDVQQVSVKATTTEQLGFVGREEGIMTQTVVLIEKVD